ncbi:MAG: hypothetical protein IT580_17790 [Verrucomicrobiales bacterium]|nr:hypothetical protein [Verrucomicrobiales bacterium]
MQPFPHHRLRVFPLSERRSLTRVEDILIHPDSPPAPLSDTATAQVACAAAAIRSARERGASVILIYGAHLLRNGAALILDRLMSNSWVTHLATNGAGSIHDWEYAWLGRSTEKVEDNVESGTFGTWDETGRNLHLALLAGGIEGRGYGMSVGRFIVEDGCTLPPPEGLATMVSHFPADPLAPAAVELLAAMHRHGLGAGRHEVVHRWKHASIFATAYRHGVPLTVHPGVGYDIVSCHPMFNGAAIGRAAEIDFKQFAGAVDQLDHGVVLNIGSAIMGPQVFEKSLSCVHNLRHQDGRPNVSGHSIYVVDLQDGGGWDWTRGEPPKSNAAYYLRFCKSYSRMGGTMQYVQADNAAFVHALWKSLSV